MKRTLEDKKLTTLRRSFEPEEVVDKLIDKYEEVFICGITGVVLRKWIFDDDSIDARTILFNVIHEDSDEGWKLGVCTTRSYCTFWLEHFIIALQAAKDWCEQNAEVRTTKIGNLGWRFKANETVKLTE